MTFNGSTLVLNANENLCNNTLSNVNTLNMSYLAQFNPKTVGNCVLWMDGSDLTTMTFSSGSNLSNWTDKSSNNYIASVFGTPVYAPNIKNSLGVIQYVVGSGNTIPSFVIPPTLSAFMVYYPNGQGTNGPPIEQGSNTALYPGFLVQSGISNFLIRTNNPAPTGLTLTESTTTMVGAWTAYANATKYTYTLYSNTIYSYTGYTQVGFPTDVTAPTATFTYGSPVGGNYYFYSVVVTTTTGTSQLAMSPIAQYATPLTASSPTTLALRIDVGTAAMSWAPMIATSFAWVLYQSDTNSYDATASNASGTTAGSNFSVSQSGLTIGKYYYFTCYASNATGVSQVAASPIVRYFPDTNNLTLSVTSSNAVMAWEYTGTSPTFYYTLYSTTAYSYATAVTTLVSSNTTNTSVTYAFTPVANTYYYYTVYEVSSYGTALLDQSPIVQYVTPIAMTNLSMQFSGSSALSVASNSALTLGTSNFTIEWWMNQTSRGTYNIPFYYDYQSAPFTANILYLNVDAGGTGLIFPNNGSGRNYVNGLPAQSLNTWHHYAIVRNGNTFSMYIDGVSLGSNTPGTTINITPITSGHTLNIGGPDSGITGYIYNFRYVIGTALYTGASYTVPTAPLTAITGTQLLIGGTGISDISPNAFAITNSSVTTSSTVPFAAYLSFTPTTPTLVIRTGVATLSWTAATSATSYNWVLYSGTLNNSYSGTALSNANTTSVSATVSSGLVIGNDYYFTVQSSNASGLSPMIASAVVEYRPTPANLTLALTSSNATLGWTSDGSGQTYYYTMYSNSTPSYTSGTALSSNSTTSTSAVVTQTSTANAFYYFSIYEVTSVGTSLTYLSPVVQYVAPAATSSSGGTIVTSGANRYHIFTGNSNLVVSAPAPSSANALIIGGGGGGGSSHGGGGGAGEVVYTSTSISNTTYAIVVGTGGPIATNGVASSAFSISANYGGKGGGNTSGSNPFTGGSGGGGGGYANSTAGAASVKTGGGLGNAGGTCIADAGGGGGGGGAGTAGSGSSGPPGGQIGGVGGNGTNLYSSLLSIISSSMPSDWQTATSGGYIAGGGGGGCYALPQGTFSAGGLGGGGYGGNNNNGSSLPAAAINYTGSGGGGGGSGGQEGAAGGTGLVVVVVPTTTTLPSPTSPTLSIVSETATMTWIPNSNATSYNWALYNAGTSNNYYGTIVGSVSSTTTDSATVSGLTIGNYYYFVVQSSNASVLSPYITSSVVRYLPTPTSMTLTLSSSNAVLNWSSLGSNQMYYYTLYSNTAFSYTGGTAVSSTIPTSNTTATITQTTGAGKYYYYEVYEVTSFGASTTYQSPISQYVSSAPSLTYTGTTSTSVVSQVTYVSLLTSGNLGFSSSQTLNYLAVAGGGAGGAIYGGGGGAGGVSQGSYTFSSGTYATTIGGGGTGGIYDQPGGNGSNTSITGTTISVTGGGGGGGFAATPGSNGGSGGGGSYSGGSGGTGISGQGYAGANAGSAGGGGGGASSSGGVAAGGNGITYGGVQVGGGGGGGRPGGVGGAGTYGGGSGGTANTASNAGSNGTPNTGGGGGAGTYGTTGSGGFGSGGNGGSGVIMLSLPASPASPTSPTLSIVSGTATMSWTAVSGVTSYNWLLYNSGTSNTYSGTAVGSVTNTSSTSATATGLTLGNFYYFAVQSSNASSVSPYVASSVVEYQPSPASLTLVLTSSNATLGWTSVGTGQYYYALYSNSTASTSGATLVSSNVTSNTSAVVTATISITAYYYYTIYEVTSYGTSPTYTSAFVYGSPIISYLIVAGGGGGGSGVHPGGAGGGGGGVLTGSTAIYRGNTYTVVVGAGGSGTGAGYGSNGSNSTALSLTAIGGGGGASGDASTGSTGGSGGGSAFWNYNGTIAGGSGTSGQGNAGGSVTSTGGGRGGGGGGGAGGAGSPYSTVVYTVPNGGDGISSSITGSAVYYGGGGGGQGNNGPYMGNGSGGLGGGGAGGWFNDSTSSTVAATSGTANTGGGGGGWGAYSRSGNSAAGGSGVVIFSILTANYTGITTGSPTITTSGSNTIIKFTANGSYTA